MAQVILMPKMSDTMTEGVIAVWHKKVGDTIKSGDIVAEVETDKATMDLEAYEGGTILYIGVEAGKSAPVDGILYIVGKSGEDYQSLLGGGSPKTEVKSEPVVQPVVSEPVSAVATQTVDTSNIKAKVERMPKMSDTMTEGVIVAWHKKVGDTIKAGELLAEIETDKAVMELEAYEKGTILYLGVEAGGKVAVDDVLYIIGEAGADWQALLNGGTKNSSASSSQTVSQTPSNNQTAVTTVVNTDSNGRVKASPLAKKIAQELGYDLSQIQGTGDGGRITKTDVENFKPSTQPQQTKSEVKTETKVESKSTTTTNNGFESYEEIPLSQMRKTIARRLSESKFTAPEFYLTIEIQMDKAMQARTRMNELSPVKISFNDIVIKAAAMALKQHPKINSSWLGDKIRVNHHVNIGVAMAVDEGLLVPVVRNTDMKSISQIAGEVKDFSQKAKDKKLQPKDWEGSTFTISNLGMYGIDEFTAIINPPDACILAVGGIKETVIVEKGEMKVANIMKVTLTCDHRVVDGATGAEFLKTLKANIEEPMRMLV
ncbi:MAG: pyruvate dehydrogenase complex dihydrolipoamide acetyltransferase [Raineya sp.]|jgi:pyruvate dehydrogenase E2 component (dihydrolipoamide acetyltransferase)|nr:pyruvate dehydrogenase complex dihydrolipoamide acetyltransferase [Raineya sp.]